MSSAEKAPPTGAATTNEATNTGGRRTSTPKNDTARRTSISANDAACLAPVETHVAKGAVKGADSEKSMTLLQGLKTYPKAVAWSIVISTCIIMEGFDIVLINNLYALPAFQRNFGERLGDGSYEISAEWQSGLSNGALVGEILGLMAIGHIVERFGYRMTLIGALVWLSCAVFLLFFAIDLPMLLCGEVRRIPTITKDHADSAIRSSAALPGELFRPLPRPTPPKSFQSPYVRT